LGKGLPEMEQVRGWSNIGLDIKEGAVGVNRINHLIAMNRCHLKKHTCFKRNFTKNWSKRRANKRAI
jgi:hypothetical protein